MKLMKAMHDRSNLALPKGPRGKVPQNQAKKPVKQNKPGGANAPRIGGKKPGMVNKTKSYR